MDRQIDKLIDFFFLEIPIGKATKAPRITHHNAERIYTIIETNLFKECDKESSFGGEIEIDDSYFDGYKEIKGKI